MRVLRLPDATLNVYSNSQTRQMGTENTFSIVTHRQQNAELGHSRHFFKQPKFGFRTIEARLFLGSVHG